MAEIMDVSRWQGSIDWDAVKRSGKIDGVMLRVLGSKGGKPYVDPAFARNYAECARLGLPVGGYYYTCAVTQRQTEEELAALKTALRGKTFQLPIAIDVEDPRLRSLAPAKLSALVPKQLPNSKRGGCMQWCTPTPISRIPPSTWQHSLLTICGSRTTAASAPPAATACGSTPAAAGCSVSPAPYT